MVSITGKKERACLRFNEKEHSNAISLGSLADGFQFKIFSEFFNVKPFGDFSLLGRYLPGDLLK